ncbi:hypothetical protein ACWEXP_14290 [Staphylococcus pseudoxylosus]|uniref:Uncharacterized protein n=1 Tax=Staphylococcus xylosus TaxID=1288 RepID=A0A077RGY4_STAXY|nr:hypothetical protein [Staphylococcus pseudoxylosus]MDW8798683.1 hypothetical protein [Staphylococcus pseudoxylosus]MEB7752555.1 hypothetical protein [Staphylococcus pseudoxylosus]PTI57049.1 hypothetical protein BU103_11085 [Staphylococcus xylosus]CDL65119.1 hypothetical protein [Staphylococcus xylosus]
MWVILTFVFSILIIALIISLIVLNDRKNEKIFNLSKQNILLQQEIKRELSSKTHTEPKKLSQSLRERSQMKKYNTDNIHTHE